MPSAGLARPTARWGSLDVLRGIGLWLMIAHHFAKWTGGRVEQRFVGVEGFVLTDLAAPIFAVGAGAAAYLVGQGIRSRGSLDGQRLLQATGRWGQVLALGLAIDLAVGGGIDGGGVLPSLAVLGLAATLLSTAGLRHPTGWWAIAAVGALTAVPLTAHPGSGFGPELLTGPFAVPVYAVFAAGGAALAAHAAAAGEEALPLVPAAVGLVGVGTAAALVVPEAVAPDGVWPPARYPGDLAYTVWGLAGTLLLWAAVRRWLPTGGVLGAAVARAGRRTLLVFGLHYLVKLGLQHAGLLETLDTRGWGYVSWIAIVGACILSTIPRPDRARPYINVNDRNSPAGAVRVVRASV